MTRTDLPVIADPVALLEELGRQPRVVTSGREAWISSIDSFIKKFMSFTSPEPKDGVDFGAVTVALAAAAPEDAIITTDAGNISTWFHRHWTLTPKNTLLGAIAGSMGFGVPAAVAAAWPSHRACRSPSSAMGASS